ncbi:hypothetical protein EVAR_29453_1 [Eumeta japonica]|uniref:Uncharacterized protein n=1 Tax=Eumeta variegata TaxID=151549 RepID=A0A4C1VW66_EUMVA|nr:hypothetical protein EVAR_29453_1 [Eumeta japonica]
MGKRACGPMENRWAPPPMDTRNPRENTCLTTDKAPLQTLYENQPTKSHTQPQNELRREVETNRGGAAAYAQPLNAGFIKRLCRPVSILVVPSTLPPFMTNRYNKYENSFCIYRSRTGPRSRAGPQSESTQIKVIRNGALTEIESGTNRRRERGRDRNRARDNDGGHGRKRVQSIYKIKKFVLRPRGRSRERKLLPNIVACYGALS